MIRRILIPASLFLLNALCAQNAHHSDKAFTFGLREGRYKVLEGSYATILREIPGAPMILPVSGSFWVVGRRIGSPIEIYAIKSGELTLEGQSFEPDGEYRVYRALPSGEPPAPIVMGEMWLQVRIPPDVPTIPEAPRKVVLHGGPIPIVTTLPWIVMTLKQIEPSPIPGVPPMKLNLIACPYPVLQFSTEFSFTSRKVGPVSHGDLIDSLGRVIRKNHELTKNFGIMPIVADLGLDAIMVPPFETDREPIWWFSLEKGAWSERLGVWLGNGDLLSEIGRVVATNKKLLENFHMCPIATPQADEAPFAFDYGLDAVSAAPLGELYFSIEKDYCSKVRHGDLLRTDGKVVKTSEELMENFEPEAVSAEGFGLDALYVWPHGEVWFSTESGFEDRELGPVSDGDLLSDRGYVVARNAELLRNFEPLEDVKVPDFGLDALELKPEPKIAAFGRLTKELETCLLLKTKEGSYYLLDNYGVFSEGDTVWVEGYLDRSCFTVCLVRCIRENTIERAVIGLCGELVGSGECVFFRPDGTNLYYSLDNYGGFSPGDRVKVTGILSDYCNIGSRCQHVLPVAPTGCIEVNTIDPCGGCVPEKGIFVRGDANVDGSIDISDVMRILCWLFGNAQACEPCQNQGGARCCCYDIYDVNDSGKIDLGDIIYLLRYLFIGGPNPPAPYPDCGPDPTPDNLKCEGNFCPNEPPRT